MGINHGSTETAMSSFHLPHQRLNGRLFKSRWIGKTIHNFYTEFSLQNSSLFLHFYSYSQSKNIHFLDQIKQKLEAVLLLLQVFESEWLFNFQFSFLTSDFFSWFYLTSLLMPTSLLFFRYFDVRAWWKIIWVFLLSLLYSTQIFQKRAILKTFNWKF